VSFSWSIEKNRFETYQVDKGVCSLSSFVRRWVLLCFRSKIKFLSQMQGTVWYKSPALRDYPRVFCGNHERSMDVFSLMIQSLLQNEDKILRRLTSFWLVVVFVSHRFCYNFRRILTNVQAFGRNKKQQFFAKSTDSSPSLKLLPSVSTCVRHVWSRTGHHSFTGRRIFYGGRS